MQDNLPVKVFDGPQVTRRLRGRVSLLALLALQCLIPARSDAQAPNATKASTQLLADALLYRRTWIEPNAPLDKCSFYQLMNAPADFPERLPPWMKQLVGAAGPSPCVAAQSLPTIAERTAPTNVLLFDSVSVGESVAMLYVTVIQGENTHRENFTLKMTAPDRRWAVQEVRVWGAMRFHRGSPAR